MSKLSEDILANVDIVDVVSRFVQLKRVGRNFVGLSPFRNERTPSFTVSPEKQIFKCFSTGIGWNVIKFIMEIERVDYRDAAQVLMKDAWLDVKDYQTKQSNPEKREKEWSEKEKYKLMMRITQQYFVDELAKMPSSLAYLHEKRQLSDEIIRKWWVWYAPDSWFGLPRLLTWKWFTEQDCIAIWLAKKWQSWDMYGFYRNRITFPINDHLWNLVGFGARAINPEDQPKYLNSSDSPLYDKSKILYGLDQAKNHLKEFDKMIVVEWYMDVIGFSRLWMPVAVATCGTSLTPNHMKLLKRYTPNIYFLFDNDPAWMQAAQRALKVAYQHDVYPKILTLPSAYKDIDERANQKPTSAEVQAIFDNAQDGFLWSIDIILAANDMQNPVERKRFLQWCFDILLYVQDFSILSWYLESISKKISMSYDIIFSQYKTFTKSQTVTVAHIRKEQETSQKITKESDINLFQAFFYNTFLQDHGIDDAKLDEIMMLVVEVAGVVGNDELLKVVSWEVEESDTTLWQAQLWWDKHWWALTPDKKILDITRKCLEYLQSAKQLMWKIKTLSIEEKIDINKRIDQIR
jgi:DNA primase